MSTKHMHDSHWYKSDTPKNNSQSHKSGTHVHNSPVRTKSCTTHTNARKQWRSKMELGANTQCTLSNASDIHGKAMNAPENLLAYLTGRKRWSSSCWCRCWRCSCWWCRYELKMSAVMTSLMMSKLMMSMLITSMLMMSMLTMSMLTMSMFSDVNVLWYWHWCRTVSTTHDGITAPDCSIDRLTAPVPVRPLVPFLTACLGNFLWTFDWNLNFPNERIILFT